MHAVLMIACRMMYWSTKAEVPSARTAEDHDFVRAAELQPFLPTVPVDNDLLTTYLLHTDYILTTYHSGTNETICSKILELES